MTLFGNKVIKDIVKIRLNSRRVLLKRTPCRERHTQGEGCEDGKYAATAKKLLEARREAWNRSSPIIFRGSMALMTSYLRLPAFRTVK